MGWVAAAAVALSVASTVATYVGQSQQASAQGKANQAYATAQSQAMVANLDSTYSQGNTQIVDQDEQANQKLTNEQMQEQAAIGTAQTQGSARGVTGNSVDAIQRDYMQRANDYDSDVEFNRTASDAEIMQQLKGAQLNMQGQDNSLSYQMTPPQQPSPLSLVAGIGSDVADAYNLKISKQPVTPSSPTTGLTNADYEAVDDVEDGIY